jgi:hypothetical protein
MLTQDTLKVVVRLRSMPGQEAGGLRGKAASDPSKGGSMRRPAALAGIAAAITVVVPATTAFASSAATSHATVAYDYWRGRTTRVTRSVPSSRASWAGNLGPVSRLHWTSWWRNTATGHGAIVIMGTFRVTVYLHDAQTSHGRQSYRDMTVSGPRIPEVHAPPERARLAMRMNLPLPAPNGAAVRCKPDRARRAT